MLWTCTSANRAWWPKFQQLPITFAQKNNIKTPKLPPPPILRQQFKHPQHSKHTTRVSCSPQGTRTGTRRPVRPVRPPWLRARRGRELRELRGFAGACGACGWSVAADRLHPPRCGSMEEAGETNPPVEGKVCTFYGKLGDSHLAGKNKLNHLLIEDTYIF